MTLVIGGVFLSFASFFLGYTHHFTDEPPGFSEFYPFFHWRLYGDPKGWQGASTYRIYSKSTEDGTWQRHAVENTDTYARYPYQLQLSVLVSEVLHRPGDDADGAEKLLAFIRSVLQDDAPYYRIVEESYDPLDLLADPANYDTTTILSIDGGVLRRR